MREWLGASIGCRIKQAAVAVYLEEKGTGHSLVRWPAFGERLSCRVPVLLNPAGDPVVPFPRESPWLHTI